MGASGSIQRELTHQRLYDLTRDTRAVMNTILQYMLKEVTVKDFLALSNPTECKKYVLFMANTLHKSFYELQVEPVRDRKGVIAFRSVRDLVAPTPESDREKQSLCLMLAYYYTRIFQIYGALALTLIDDISSMREAGIMTEGPRQGLVAPGQRPMFYGGAITDQELGDFSFLKGFLLDEKTNHGWRTKFHEQNGIYGEVYFSIKSEEGSQDAADPMAIPTSRSRKGVFTFDYGGAQRFSTIEIRVERVATTTTPSTSSPYGNTAAARSARALRITFENLRYAKRGETVLTTAEIPRTYMSRVLPLLYPVTTGEGQTTYAFRDTTLSVNEALQDALYHIMKFTKVLVEEGRILDKVSNAERVTGKTNATKIPHSEVLKELSVSEENTVEELRLGKILHNLTQTKPYGHCIARALQLLDSAPYKDHPAISHICKAKFLEVTGQTEKGASMRYTRSGIPEPGSALTTSPGLLALSMLFYDTIAVGTPKLTINQKPDASGKSSLQQYTEFMRRMATYFGDNKDPGSSGMRSNDSLREKGLAGISNRRDRDICEGDGGDIIIDSKTAVKVQGIVQGMFQEQLEHSSVCGNIFRMMFDIQREPTTGRLRITLHENIVRGGTPEINRINYVARQQLMKYYSNCEVKYLEGMKAIIDSKRKEAAAAAEAQRKKAEAAAAEAKHQTKATPPVQKVFQSYAQKQFNTLVQPRTPTPAFKKTIPAPKPT